MSLEHLRSDEGITVEVVEDPAGPPSEVQVGNALRLLARWLIATAPKGAAGAASTPAASPQNRLDECREAKVVSKPG